MYAATQQFKLFPIIM